MGPRTQPLGNPRHVSGWVQKLSFCSQAEQGRMRLGKTPQLPPLSRQLCKCSSLGIQLRREHPQPKDLAKTHWGSECQAPPPHPMRKRCRPPLRGMALSLRLRT